MNILKKIHFNVRDKASSNVYIMYENIFSRINFRNMKLIVKFGEWFFRNRETKKQKSFVERILRHSPTLGFTLCLISFISISLSAKPYETTELSSLKQQLSNTKIKVFSQVCTMRKEIIRQTNEIESLIYDSDSDSRTNLKPFNNIITGQEHRSETNPKVLLPP
jgi:hypothetical protein